jgi:phosphoglycerate dehydrogenase-like enzyme/glyoxylase-like metal-dependent hydrolase (beta-lactamase superfamily II)
MKILQTHSIASPTTTPLLLIAALIFGLTAAGSAAGVELPNGIVVRSLDSSGRNQIWIDIGDDVLAIDVAVAESAQAEMPRFGISTNATGVVRAATELRPEFRLPRDHQADRATIVVRSGFTLEGPEREVVFIDVGRAATAGDVVVWLPGDKVLITGRICDRDRVVATHDSDTLAWTKALNQLLDLEPEVVVPGRGAPGDDELLSAQIERLDVVRAHVETGLLAGHTATDVTDSLTAPWFTTWRADDPTAAGQSIHAVFDEIGGLRPPWELIEERMLREGPSPTRKDTGWSKPQKVLWRNYWPDRLPMLEHVAPGVEIIPFDNSDEAMGSIGDADALIGTANAELLAAGENLRWVQVGSAGVERYLEIPELASGEVLLTNGQRLASPVIGEHVMALTRALARGLNRAVAAQNVGQWQRSEIGNSAPLTRLRGKTMLVVGLGGIGTEVARLASAAGMRVTAIRNSRRSGPPFVAKVGLGEDLVDYLRDADVVANCLPLTPDTKGKFDAALFDAMKPTAFFVNVGRGGTVNTSDLATALETGEIAGAGLDVTDPEPLPEGHPLWKAPNLIITPHFAAWSDAGRERRWLLYRENLRRFVAGERMLSVVDPERGY